MKLAELHDRRPIQEFRGRYPLDATRIILHMSLGLSAYPKAFPQPEGQTLAELPPKK